MNDRINTLDELLSDPMVKLVMERDRVQPAELRSLLEEKVRRDDGMMMRRSIPLLIAQTTIAWHRPLRPPAHMVAESCHNLWLCG